LNKPWIFWHLNFCRSWTGLWSGKPSWYPQVLMGGAPAQVAKANVIVRPGNIYVTLAMTEGLDAHANCVKVRKTF
jgi:histidinol dehydrogenase